MQIIPSSFAFWPKTVVGTTLRTMYIKDKLAVPEEIPDLETMISLTTCLDNHLREKEAEVQI